LKNFKNAHDFVQHEEEFYYDSNFFNHTLKFDYFDFTTAEDFQIVFENFNKKRVFFLYFYFVKLKFTFFEKIMSKKFMDYSGTYLKGKSNFIKMMLETSLIGGNKLSMIRHFNHFHNNFYYFFSKKIDFFSQKFSSYDVYYQISEQNINFFNINLLLKSVLNLNDSMFNLRIINFTKSQRKYLKTKKKFFFEVVYLPKYKRQKTILKLINRHAHVYNCYSFHERLLMSFCNSFFFQKNSFLYQRKMFIYKNAFSKTKKERNTV
jgi:hypothetical protein